MNISKVKALWALVTGGWSGFATYVLESVNKWLAKLEDKEKLSKAAGIVNSVIGALTILIDSFIPERYKAAAKATLAALNTLAESLKDGQVTTEELDANINAVTAAIGYWKEMA